MHRYRSFLNRFLARLTLRRVVMILLPIAACLLWLRFWGLPTVVKTALLHEVEKRHLLPYPIAVDRLLFDPTGAILVQRLTVFRDPSQQRILLQVDRVRVGLALYNWWRGKGLMNSASVANAEVRLPVGPESTMDLHQVNADITFDGKDIRVENAQARCFSLALYLRGTIHNDGFATGTPATQEQLESRQNLYRSFVSLMDDIGMDNPMELQVDFETSSRDMAEGRANFDLEAHHITWRTAPISELALHGSLLDGVMTLPDLHMNLSRGELTGYGEWSFADRHAFLEFNSSLDFTLLAPAFQGPLQETLNRLDFPQNVPSITGRVLMNLEHGFKADVQADLDWKDFTFNDVPVRSLTIPLAYDGDRLLVPEMAFDSQAGKVEAKFFYDKTKTVPELKAQMVSTLDPTLFKGIFGGGTDNFLNSCQFSAGGPAINATVTSSELKTDAWLVKGKMNASKFSYKNAEIQSAVANFTLANSRLELSDLVVQRNEGSANGGILYDFKNRAVELHHFTAQVNVQQVAPIMGPKFTEYTSPYRFTKPPTIQANGIVDLQSDKKELNTDLVIELQGRSPMEWTLFSIPYLFDEPQGTLTFKNRSLKVNMSQCGFYGGNLTGEMDLNLRTQPSGFVLDLNLDKTDFQKFMIRTFNNPDSKGSMRLQTHLNGAIGKMEELTGNGEVKVSDGDIIDIPFLGSLTPLIPGFTRADAAHGNFTVSKGLIHTEDLNISSEAFALIGNGNYNFIQDKLDLDMRVNANGPFGVILFPVSKIFEYHGSGPMKKTKWVPKNF